MPRIIHPVAGLVAILTIATFWFSTVIAELFLSQGAVVALKTMLPWGFLMLVPALVAAGGSGVGQPFGILDRHVLDAANPNGG